MKRIGGKLKNQTPDVLKHIKEGWKEDYRSNWVVKTSECKHTECAQKNFCEEWGRMQVGLNIRKTKLIFTEQKYYK